MQGFKIGKTMKKAIWAGCLCVLLSVCGYIRAQDIPASFADIVRSDKIDTLLYRQSLLRAENPITGYRVLIFSQGGNNSKDAAFEEKERFEEAFPESKVYVSFEEPYFKVKAGNFIDRMQADFFLREIKILYPYAFIVKDVLDVKGYLGLDDKAETDGNAQTGVTEEEMGTTGTETDSGEDAGEGN